MKKIFTLIVVLFVLAAIPATVFLVGQRQELRKKAAPATTLSFAPSTVTKNVGEIFTLDATVDTAANQVVAAELHITFDPEKLEAVSITNGSLAPNVLVSGIVERGTASITVGAAGTTTPIKGTGIIATIRMKALQPTSSAAPVRFASNTFLASLGETGVNVLVGTTPATVTVTGTGGAVSTDSAVSVPTPTNIQQQLQTNAATPSAIVAPSSVEIFSPTQDASTDDAQPIIQGKALPGATVTITIYSTPQTYIVTADANGNWAYTPETPLESGPHNIVVTAQDPTSGNTQTATTSFVVAGAGASGSSQQEVTPVAGNATFTIVALILGIIFIASGIAVSVVF